MNNAGSDLSKPGAAEQFCRDWPRMARRVMDAAERGVDPFTTPLFDDAEFARERAYLARDREVYRQDVTRGERWIVSLPDGPPKSSALVIHKPKSLLFKHWARGDDASPTGDGYLLLAVQWEESDWVFSTDPFHRLSLKPLWEILNAAELKVNPQATGDEQWFDGAPFAHTLIAEPKRQSRLTDEKILQIVKQWCRARTAKLTERTGPKFDPWPLTRRQAVLAASAAGVLGISWFVLDRYRKGGRGARGQDHPQSDDDGVHYGDWRTESAAIRSRRPTADLHCRTRRLQGRLEGGGPDPAVAGSPRWAKEWCRTERRVNTHHSPSRCLQRWRPARTTASSPLGKSSFTSKSSKRNPRKGFWRSTGAATSCSFAGITRRAWRPATRDDGAGEWAAVCCLFAGHFSFGTFGFRASNLLDISDLEFRI